MYDPIKDDLFCTEKGRGAFVNNSRIRFSSTKSIENALFVFDDNEVLIKFSKTKFFKNIKLDIRLFGCRCLDLAYLSSGKIDCYVSDEEFEKNPDPGMLFIKESGGMINKKKLFKKFFLFK